MSLVIIIRETQSIIYFNFMHSIIHYMVSFADAVAATAAIQTRIWFH